MRILQHEGVVRLSLAQFPRGLAILNGGRRRGEAAVRGGARRPQETHRARGHEGHLELRVSEETWQPTRTRPDDRSINRGATTGRPGQSANRPLTARTRKAEPTARATRPDCIKYGYQPRE
jgi:hypothetical protein